MIVNDFVKKNPSFKHSDTLNDICNPLRQWDISYFSHVRMNHQKQMHCLAQAPQFLRHYIEKGFYNFDIHHLQPDTNEQYLLWDLVERKGLSKQMHDDFLAYGYGHTFTIIRQSGEHVDYYNFAMSCTNHGLNESYFQQLHQLKAFIGYFHDQVNMNKDLREAYNLPLQCGDGEYLSSLNVNKHTYDFLVDKIYVPSANCYLSRREYDCLHWAANGKSQEQIAQILNITPRTVKAHFANLREKLNCFNQFQLGIIFAELQNYWKP